jgi:hypothetical protein
MSGPDEPLNDLERALRALAPAPARLDRDGVMYRAGQAAADARRFRGGWWAPLAASLVALAGAGLGSAATMALRPPRVVERLVVVREPAPTPATSRPELAVTPAPVPSPAPLPRSFDPVPDSGPARLRWLVARYGADALPEPPALAAGPRAGGDPSALRKEIDQLLNPGDTL